MGGGPAATCSIAFASRGIASSSSSSSVVVRRRPSTFRHAATAAGAGLVWPHTLLARLFNLRSLSLGCARCAVDFVSSGTGHRHCRQWLACFLLWSWILDAEPGAGKRKQVEFAMLPRLTHLDLQQHHQHQYKQHKQHSHADSRARGGAQWRPLAGRKLRHQPPLPRTLSSSWPRD